MKQITTKEIMYHYNKDQVVNKSQLPDWVAYYKAIVQWNAAVSFVANCPHQWEQKPLLTGFYHKCLLCNEEKL